VVAPFLPDAEKLAAVREALPALGAGIYLNTGSVGPLPSETAAAMAELVEYELRVGRGHPDDFERFLERMDEARAAVAAVIGADVDEIAILHGTGEAMNAALWGTPSERGDRIVTTSAEHPAGLGPVHLVAERSGAEIAIADVGNGGDDERTLAAFDAAITDRTRLVSLSHVLYSTGGRLPVREIAELAHRRDARVVVDGAQAVGAMSVSVAELGVDFYAVPAQKWLLGPEGMGALWVSPEVLAETAPSMGSWFSFERLTASEAVPRSTSRRFDGASYHRPSVTGFARSCGWLSMYVGLPWIFARGLAMAGAAADRLARIDGVELVTPRDRMATLVTFRVAGWTAEAVLAELGSRAFAIARTIPGIDAVRISVGFFTTEEEIERVASVVELLAAHTPATLPPRPRLTILGAGPA
jgi:L-cysteine/cystine lyase